MQLTWETPLRNGGSMITGYIIERCEDGTDKWLRCNARLCPDLFYKVLKPGFMSRSCSQREEPLRSNVILLSQERLTAASAASQ